jgi:proteasome lid subunit RPN8/RPN11
MILEIPRQLLDDIHAHGEAAYPEESAGLLLGQVEGESRTVAALLPLTNAREQDARHNRYLITARDMLKAEQEAASRGLEILGVFHSHPDHPNRPSEFDREWALPWFSYLITTVSGGRARASRSWRLVEDRSGFDEEQINLVELIEGTQSPGSRATD